MCYGLCTTAIIFTCQNDKNSFSLWIRRMFETQYTPASSTSFSMRIISKHLLSSPSVCMAHYPPLCAGFAYSVMTVTCDLSTDEKLHFAPWCLVKSVSVGSSCWKSQGCLLPTSQRLQALGRLCPCLDSAGICVLLSFLGSLGPSVKTLDKCIGLHFISNSYLLYIRISLYLRHLSLWS